MIMQGDVYGLYFLVFFCRLENTLSLIYVYYFRTNNSDGINLTAYDMVTDHLPAPYGDYLKNKSYVFTAPVRCLFGGRNNRTTKKSIRFPGDSFACKHVSIASGHDLYYFNYK